MERGLLLLPQISRAGWQGVGRSHARVRPYREEGLHRLPVRLSQAQPAGKARAADHAGRPRQEHPGDDRQGGGMKLAIALATRNRPDLLIETLARTVPN